MKRKSRLPHKLGRWKSYINQHIERLFTTVGVGKEKGLIKQKELQPNLPE